MKYALGRLVSSSHDSNQRWLIVLDDLRSEIRRDEILKLLAEQADYLDQAKIKVVVTTRTHASPFMRDECFEVVPSECDAR